VAQLPAAKAEDVGYLTRELVRRGWITRWHAEKLLAGKYKGFFLGKYKLLDHLGSGGMSHVFLAEQAVIHRRVAVKVLPPAKLAIDGYLDRFLREAKAAAQLDHPNIVRAYDVDSHEGMYFLVMEYIEGENLLKKVNKSGPLAFEEAGNYTAQAARGLHHAHQANLVHRDVKPSNLLLTSEGVIKLLDLGLALLSSDPSQNEDRTAGKAIVLGTADYLAPEQARSSSDVDHRADIYSLGCTLYFLLCGRAPFAGGTFAERVRKHQFEKPLPIQAVRPNCPPLLVAICERAMSKAPAARYDSAAEIDQLLTGWLHQTTQAPSPRQVTAHDDPDSSEPTPASPETTESRSNGERPLDHADSGPVMPVVIVNQPPHRANLQRMRTKPTIKTPFGFWLFLGALVVILWALVGYLIFRRG
jgi:serine/threonine-protein kinase